jgi:hypothetical protein
LGFFVTAAYTILLPSGPESGRRDKYSATFSKQSDSFIPGNLPEEVRMLISASISGPSWQRNMAAINSLKLFASEKGAFLEWPLSDVTVQQYIVWATVTKKLKPSTVKAYLCILGQFHKLRNLDSSSCNNTITKSMLKGAENLALYNDIVKQSRKVMTFHLLKVLGHQLASSDWLKEDKQVLWTAFLVAFFGSFRFGEILSDCEIGFNPNETLLWKDIIFKNDSVLLVVKFPKARSKSSETVDLFEFSNSKYCPVAALRRLKFLKGKNCQNDVPVFQFCDMQCLTPKKLNIFLREFLHPVIGEKSQDYSGHSFRAALPSVLANNPSLASDSDIRMWGRWNSESYKVYTRLSPHKRKDIFNKIMASLPLL